MRSIEWIELLELLDDDAVLRTYGPYLSTDEVATIRMLVLPPVQLQLKLSSSCP
jgi:hypothetical protein